MDTEDIFATETTARSYLNQAYWILPFKHTWNATDSNVAACDTGDTSAYGSDGVKKCGLQQHPIGCISDEAVCGRQTVQRAYQSDNLTAVVWDKMLSTDYLIVLDTPLSYYKYIRRCLYYIEYVETIPNVSTSFVTETTAEAKAIMACCYVELMKMYGSMPFIEYVYNTTTDSETGGYRPPLAEYVAKVDELLVDAIAGLPDSYTSASDMGKITKPFAHLLRSRLWLYIASPLFNKETSAHTAETSTHSGMVELNYATSYDSSLWTKAAEVTLAAITYCEGQGIKLVNTGNPHEDYTNATQYLTNNTECIWFSRRKQIVYGSENYCGRQLPYGAYGKQTGDAGYRTILEGLAGMSITQNFVELYRDFNGNDVDHDEATRYNPKGSKPWDDLEPRFGASVLYDGLEVETTYSKAMYDTEGYGYHFEFVCDLEYSRGAGKWSTGYCMRKNLPDDLLFCETRASISFDFVDIFRIAELYLNYAEAINESGNPSAAVPYLIKTMERGGLDAATMTTKLSGLDEDAMREQIMRERAIELAFEGFRYYDCKRWLRGDLIAQKKRAVRYAEYFTLDANGDIKASDYRFNQDVSTENDIVFFPESEFYANNNFTGYGDDGYVIEDCISWFQYTNYAFPECQYVWPIPSLEMAKDVGWVQNPGYEY